MLRQARFTQRSMCAEIYAEFFYASPLPKRNWWPSVAGNPAGGRVRMLRGDFRQFSVERLLRFLVALNHEVEIKIRAHRERSNPAALHVS